MKLQYKPLEKDSLSSVYISRVNQPYMGRNWHFHKEFELIYFLKGSGMRIVGDHISNFRKGELVLVGEWLPHLWRNETDNPEEADADFIIIKFLKKFDDVDLFALPELAEIRSLLKKSSRGLLFSEKVLPNVHDVILRLNESQSTQKIISFLNVLQILSNEQDYQLLSSPDFALPTQLASENRLEKVISHIFDNYAHPVSLEEIAGIAFMTPPAFCRFFKNRTNKTFFHFLNEFRVGQACQLLINGEKAIKQICYEVGFNSLTNFNRAFKNFKSSTPSEYRASYKTIRD